MKAKKSTVAKGKKAKKLIVKKGKKATPKKPYWKEGQLAMNEASKGNEWWRLRSKHGRDKLFANPQLLWEAACEYFEHTDNNPEYMVKPMVTSVGDNQGSEVQMVKVPVRQPYTLHGLCIYIGCATSYLRYFKSVSNDEAFLTVIAEIEDVVYKQQYNGASSGFFNANIISRALGLVDRQDRTSGDMPIQAPVIQVLGGDSPKLSGSEEEVEKKNNKKK